MGKVAWRKVLRDLWLTRGRTTVLAFAVAVSLTVVGAVLSAYGILAREMPRSFLSSNPASATLVLDRGGDPTLLDAVRQRTGIAEAERRAMVRARVETAAGTVSLRLFVVEDFAAMRVETVALVEGAWPPVGAIVLDRTSLPLLETRVGSPVTVSTSSGRPRAVQVAGVVFDGGVAPAWQEKAASGYVTPATLSWLGDPAELDLLKIVFEDVALDPAAIERAAQELSAWLTQQGVVVEEIRIPPPGQHPHQGLMNALALLLLLFGLLALGLSGLLVTTMISAILARHVRQIGAMKAIGAQPSHIALMYGAMVLAIGAAGVALALVPGALGGLALATLCADRSNVALASRAIPWWSYATVAMAGLLTPLLAAAAPVAAASQMTIREAISEIGLYQGPAAASRGSAAWGSAVAARVVRALGPSLVLALRHAVRSRSRLALSLVLLAAGGGAFMSGLNVAASSERQLEGGIATLGYDLELTLSQPQPTDSLLRLVRAVPGVAHAEPVGLATVAPVRPGEAPVVGTHKDGAHGTLRLAALVPETRFQPPVQSGRWLRPGDVDAIVVAPGQHEGIETGVGDTVLLSLAGRTTAWRVVGLLPTVRGPGGGSAGLYVSDAGLAQATGRVGSTQAVRVIAAEHDATAVQTARRALERSLTAEGIGVSDVGLAETRGEIVRAHMAIVQGALQSLGAVMGLVGALALASAMSLSVVERTREFGVMQTLGATPGRVIWVVVAEALAIGALSWIAAVALSLMLTSFLGARIGSALFGAPLPLFVSAVALLIWLAVALLGSAAASAFPARAASRLTIRETLVYA